MLPMSGGTDPTTMRVALVSATDWREAIRSERERGAELICLPHLSFTPYFAVARDRAGLELAERAPSRTMHEALALADGAWLAASAYESEGEGVFYVTSRLAGPGGRGASYRQHRVEAEPQRYEQMFWSPGHDVQMAVELPAGPATTLVGADLRDPDAWARVAACGARIVIGGASDTARIWARTERVVAGMAAAHELTALAVNRADEHLGVTHPGGIAAFGPDGVELSPSVDGHFELEGR